jgi:hypothetical protein
MANTRLLQTICTVAMLAAAAAFAQTDMPTGGTPAGGAPNNPTGHQAMPNDGTPADKMGSPNGSMGSMGSHMGRRSTHHRAEMGAMHGRSEASQDAAVDQLNERSYQAARSGQAFNGSDAMAAPGGSGRMMHMQRGSTSGSGRMGGEGSGGGSGM